MFIKDQIEYKGLQKLEEKNQELKKEIFELSQNSVKVLEDLELELLATTVKFKNRLEDKKLKEYEIKRIGRLSLCFMTIIGRKPRWNEITICMWNKDFTSRWTIADFEYDDDEDFYYLKECADRLSNEDVNWEDFGELVKYARKYLNTEGEI